MAREDVRENSSTDEPPSERLGRRTFLKAASASVALVGTTAGCTTSPPDVSSVETNTGPVSFGYGGAAVSKQQLPVPGALVGSIAAATTTVEESEPNDSEATADAVGLGSSVWGSLSGDEDWYAVDLSEGGSLQLSLTRSTNKAKATFELYDTENARVESKQVPNDKPVVITLDPVPTKGTYYVCISSDKRIGSYELSVDGTQPTPTQTPTPTPTQTQTPTPTPTPSPDDEYGDQRYGEYGYGGTVD